MACKSCRARKIKCDRMRPICQNCRLRMTQCTYAGERRKRGWTDDSIGSGLIVHSDSLHHQIPDGGEPQHNASMTRELPPVVSFSSDDRNQYQPSQQRPSSAVNQLNASSTTTDSSRFVPRNPQSLPALPYDSNALLQTPAPASPKCGYRGTLLDKILNSDDAQGLTEGDPALWARVNNGDEYTGPSSGISAISDMGLKWIRDHVSDSDILCKTIQDIRNGILNHLRQPKCIPPDLPLSPKAPSNLSTIPPSKIMRYVEAYFLNVQVIFPVLDKKTFLNQLATFGTDLDSTMYSWNALLSAVLASGCRAALSDETPDAFQKSGREAWGYFQNALSYDTNIFHGSADLMAAQAFAVMTVFAQGLSSPQRLEYTLCSTASRLAQSLALHCHPLPEWNLTEREKRERDRVFWVIYCLDKTIALRCGRPTVIHDEEISCSFPHGVQVNQGGGNNGETSENVQDLDLFLCFTKFARICGTIAQQLYSATALRLSSTQLLGRLHRILEDLELWRQIIPAEIEPGRPIGRLRDTLKLSLTQVVVLHSSYYYALCAVYRRLSPMFAQDQKNIHIPHNTHPTHVEAARSMVLLTKHLDVESFTPGWLVFYYPFTALTTIFVHVVSYPPIASTQNDIALMETIVGFLGRLEYVTSGEAAFTNTAEFVRQARLFVNRHINTCRVNVRAESPISEKNRRADLALLRDHMDADRPFLGPSDNFTNEPRSPLRPSRGDDDPLVGLIPSPQSESARCYPTGSMVSSHQLGMADADHSPHPLYTDLAGLLSPSVEIPNEQWVGAWISTG